MTERIKDLIYDFSDLLLVLIIIGCMFLVISWKITDIMDIPFVFNDVEASITTPTELEEISKDLSSDDQEVIISLEDAVTESPSTPENVTSNNPTLKTPEVRSITIEIPKGTLGVGIANILKKEGLITDSSEFISRVEELKLAPKLRFGTFSIKTNDSIDEIIHILTGTN